MGTNEISNFPMKTECVAARVCASRKARGRFIGRLIAPVQQRIFFVLSTLEAQERSQGNGYFDLLVAFAVARMGC